MAMNLCAILSKKVGVIRGGKLPCGLILSSVTRKSWLLNILKISSLASEDWLYTECFKKTSPFQKFYFLKNN